MISFQLSKKHTPKKKILEVYNGVTKSGSLPKFEFLLLCTYRKSRIVVTFEMDKKWATFHFFIFFINFLCPKTLKSKLDLQQT